MDFLAFVGETEQNCKENQSEMPIEQTSCIQAHDEKITFGGLGGIK